MKVSIEVGKGWCAAQSVCKICGYDFLLIRQRKDPVNVKCPNCEQNGFIEKLETPWVGLIEEVVNDGQTT